MRGALRESLGDVPGARGEIEDGVAAAEREAGDERRGNRSAERRDSVALRVPADGSRVPAPSDFVGRLYAATPLNCGRMSRP